MKITEEELSKLKEQETKKNQIALEMGALDYKKHNLSKLLDDLVELQEMTLEDINEKFPSLNDDMKRQVVNRILKAEGAPTLTQNYRGLGGDNYLKEQAFFLTIVRLKPF